MVMDLSFTGLCKSLKDEFSSEIVDDVDAFSSVILALAVAATAGPVALEQIYLQERAFRLLCYTAFFEALTREKRLEPLLKKAKLTRNEKLLFSEVAAKRLWGKADEANDNSELSFLNYEIELPHPTDTFEQQKQLLQPLYQSLAKGALHFFAALRVWEEMKEEQQRAFTKAIEDLPENANKYFTAQYYLLATRDNDFYIWSNLQEHQKTRKQQAQTTSAFLQKYTQLAEKMQHTIDTGLKSLDEIYQIPERSELYSADRMMQILERKYKNVLEEPIFKDDSDGDELDLIYPKKGRIFIPQAFQVIHYTGKEQLGLDTTWNKEKVPENDNLGLFLRSNLVARVMICA